MRWKNLVDSLCPKCGTTVMENEENKFIVCSNGECDFKISEEKLEVLLDKLSHKQKTTPNKNLFDAEQIESNNE